MPRPTDIAGLGGLAFLGAATLVGRRFISSLPRSWIALLLATVALVMLVPLGTLPLAGYVRGAIGDLSLPTTVLAVRATLRPFTGWNAIEGRQARILQFSLALSGLLLYPLALGIGPVDPYRWGFGEPWLVGLVSALAFLSWLSGLELVALVLALALFAYGVGGLESTNLWDYLIDPLVWLWALSGVLGYAKRLRAERS
jgi:hypothetical protein